jgi:murein DD-endopeptidase MepM/ murein hydrolase activator NlpD
MRSGGAYTKRLRDTVTAVAAFTLVVTVSAGMLAYKLTDGVEAAEHAAATTDTHPAVAPTPSTTPAFGTGGLPPSLAAASTPAAAPAEPRPRFDWPAQGEITSVFDAEHPLGIDIGVWTGDAIHASGAGTVVFAGGTACCLYGLYVDIEHGEGYLTRYAHLSEIKVEESQVVAQGDLVGLAGNTGYSFGPHLHFELLHDGLVQDPLQFLPPQ